MAPPTWPPDLPVQPLTSAYDEQPPRVLVRTPMESGPAKVRRKLSNNIRLVPLELRMTETQMETFDEFFMETLLGGALRFTWTHPRTGENIDSRIVSDDSQGPSYRYDGKQCYVSFLLEVLP